jgi:hypothetical protein
MQNYQIKTASGAPTTTVQPKDQIACKIAKFVNL